MILRQNDEHRVWEAALDRLELDLLRAEQMTVTPAAFEIESWDEPRLDSPLPADLVERAQQLRARQQQVQAALTAALTSLNRQHAFAERVDRATAQAASPVYVDVSA